jgi:hypothetical protein
MDPEPDGTTIARETYTLGLRIPAHFFIGLKRNAMSSNLEPEKMPTYSSQLMNNTHNLNITNS